MLFAAIFFGLTFSASAEVLWNAQYKKNIRIWDEDPRHHFPYYLGAFEIKNPYFPYSYRGRYSRERHENSLNPYEIVGFHYIPYSKLGRSLAYYGDRLVHTERKKYGAPNFIVPRDVPRRRDGQIPNQRGSYGVPRQDGLQKRTVADQGIQKKPASSFKLPYFNWRELFRGFYGKSGDVYKLYGEALANMFGPVFTVVFFLLIITIAIWIGSSAFAVLTVPIRFLFGIKAPVLRRFIVRLISYYAQDLITKMQTSLPFSGTLQVPAEGLEIAKPQSGENIGFTLSVPATTITYSYNLSAAGAAKLQALLDAFNEVFNIQRGAGSGGASGRSGDEEDDRFERILSISDNIKETIGDRCEDNPIAVRETSMAMLCDRANQALQLTASIMPQGAESLGNSKAVTQVENPDVL